ncbi:MAG: MFS transporter [Acidimicrobiia bacterium]|nr:MFS transporter [Acidimicrobiia bacterium]
MHFDVRVTRPDFGPPLSGADWSRAAMSADLEIEATGNTSCELSHTRSVLGRVDITVGGAGVAGEVEARGRAEVDLPYFGWIFRPLLTRRLRRDLDHVLDVGQAARDGERPPPAPTGPAWFPDVPWTPHQVRSVATATVALAVVAYAATLVGATSNAFTESFGMTDSQLALLLGITRVGTLLALVGAWLADKAGRRRILLASLTALVLLTALSGFAPDAVTFGALQTLTRGLVNLAGPVAAMIVIEESPERARASTLAIVFLGGALGGVLANALLPILDLGPEAWRGIYVLAVLFLPLILHMARHLPETRRFAALAERGAETGRVGEVVDRRYGRRFAIVTASAFLLNFAAAPSAQLTMRYLQNERDFSGSEVLLLRALMTAIPGLLAVLLGGVMAEARGRIVVVRLGLAVAAVADILFFTTGGVFLWVWTAVGTTGSGFAAPAYGAVSNEMFPTEVRGTAQGGSLLLGVLGSILGLFFVGLVRGAAGSIGTAIALTDIAPLVVVLFVYGRLPESRGRALDDISPTEV